MNVEEQISSKAAEGRFLISLHAAEEMGQEQIAVDELARALLAARLVEDYPDDPRGASCLVLGRTVAGRPIHAVVGWLDREIIKIITVYRPDLRPDKWEQDWNTRRDRR